MTFLPGSPQVTLAEIANSQRLLVHCWASWNAHDRVLGQRLNAVRKDFEHSLLFRSCDIDDPHFAETLRAWNVLNVPALVLLERGHKRGVKYGALSEQDLTVFLREWADQP